MQTYRFIEEQNRRILQEQPSNSHPLLLSSRYHETSLSDLCFVLVGQTLDGLVDLCFLRSCNHFFIGGIKPSITNVVHDVGVEQGSILRHDADSLAQRFELNILDILPVYQDPASLRIVESEQQPEYRGFSTPGRANNGDFLPGGNGEAEVLEDRASRVIAKVDILKLDLSAFQLQRLGGRRVLSNIFPSISKLTGSTSGTHADGGLSALQVEHDLHVNQTLPQLSVNGS
jgi:hypothetical protein